MPPAVLATKLFAPPPRPRAVLRKRLTDRLDEGIDRKLSLVCAPAGFGKTALVSEWIEACGRPAAWLALDAGDKDATRFLVHLVAALQTVDPRLGAELSGRLETPRPLSVEAALTGILNGVAGAGIAMLLVLDDYHAADSAEVDALVRFLLEHSPPQLHLVITTREDPNLPLARLRASDQVTELRAPDLRFTPDETAEFLNGAMRLGLTPEDTALLAARTEGWIAGLQLAALSLRGREEVVGFIADFAGDNRYIMDYLLTEVLDLQPERVRTFLLQTSVLERLCGPLCDAVTGHDDGRAMLEALERGNYFVVPLDERRHWYRFHHLFRGVLGVRLLEEQPTEVALLHRRASEWYEGEGSLPEAVEHALAARDHHRAADLIELAAPPLRRLRQEATLLAWLRSLPGEVLAARPSLAVTYAHTLIASGELRGVDALLLAAERTIESSDIGTARRGVVGEHVDTAGDERRVLLAAIATARAGLALSSGDAAGTARFAGRVLELVPEHDHFTRGAAAAFLGLAYWTQGELEAACASYAAGVAHLETAGNVADAVGGHIAVAAIQLAQGRLRQAAGTYERGLRLAGREGVPLRGTADMLVGLAEIASERDDLIGAERYLETSAELGDGLAFPQNRYRWRVAMARVRTARGEHQAALALLDDAERLYAGDFHPDVRPVAAIRARLLLAMGRLHEALEWARERGLSADPELDYVREFEHLTYARLLLAQAERTGDEELGHRALRLLDRLLDAAERGSRLGSVLAILVSRALGLRAAGQGQGARADITRALALAEPEGYVRLFLDEGKPLAALLRDAARHDPDAGSRYVRQLRAALAHLPGDEQPTVGSATGQPLVEPLSQRELQVLRLLRSDLNGLEIARELRVSVNTVRTHTKHVYSKLDVNSRRAAVRRAEELRLI